MNFKLIGIRKLSCFHPELRTVLSRHPSPSTLSCLQSQRESGGSEMRGDLPLWWTRSPEDEVPEVPPQAHEHQTLSWAHPLPRPLQDPLAYHPLQAGHKYCLLGRLSLEVGWNHYDTIRELEKKRKERRLA
ncbi:unnamed protein product, partial [Vitis vinifera]